MEETVPYTTTPTCVKCANEFEPKTDIETHDETSHSD